MVEWGEFVSFAAATLEVAPERLTPETSLGTIPEWDSLAHLRLVMDAKSRFGLEIPFAEVVDVRSLWEFFRRLNSLPPKKAVAVDLDGTLWSGVASEDGAGGVKIDEAFAAKLKELKGRGALLVALSKNDFEDVKPLVEAFGDFVAWRIDWNRKADNLADVARELNIGLDAFVFVDDNPAERAEMAALAPEVAVASFPPDLDAYFPPTAAVTDEDRAKTEEYRAEAKRREWAKARAAERSAGFDVWEEIGAWIDVHPLRGEEVERVAQLSQKANQFRMSPRRYAAAEVRAWEGAAYAVRAGDRVGDMGLVAFVRLLPAHDGGGGLEVADWTMSCRAAGRGLEERAWREIEAAAGAGRYVAAWRRGAKNAPSAALFDRLGFSCVSETEEEKRYERIP